MAKMPGWIKVRQGGVKDGQLTLFVSINWWHPGAWWHLLRVLCRGGAE